MQYLIACLGNPGKKYFYNRHNIGFRIGDELISRFHLDKMGHKFLSEIYSGSIAGTPVLMIKPETYMNNSGEAVRNVLSFYKVPIENLLVIYDDFDLPFGTLRLRKKGSPGTHNGMKSVVKVLGSQDFPRLRVGIGPLPPDMSVVSFVLADFNKTEEEEVPGIIDESVQVVRCLYEKGIDAAMNPQVYTRP